MTLADAPGIRLKRADGAAVERSSTASRILAETTA
jgi:hypothetical protein